MEHAHLLRRLQRLERALLTVRRMIGDATAVTPLPATAFRALAVRVAGDSYAVPVDRVVEIVRFAKLTRVSNAPRAVLGVLNLRGRVVVVLDVRERLGLGATEIDAKTAIVVATLHDHEIGLVVDRVREVVLLEPSELDAPTGPLAEMTCIHAVGTIQGALVQLLDLERVLSANELENAVELSQNAEPTAASDEEESQ